MRGVDFGLGIGYNADAASKPFSQTFTKPKPVISTPAPSRGAATDALKVGMMARFKSSFVAASPGVAPGGSGSSPAGTMKGFVQGATLGGQGPSGAPSSGTKSDQSQTKERPRQRRRPSGWDQ